jgi:hypothetical protein
MMCIDIRDPKYAIHDVLLVLCAPLLLAWVQLVKRRDYADTFEACNFIAAIWNGCTIHSFHEVRY